MTQNALQTLTFIFAWGWRFLTSNYIPGTNVTPGAVILFVFLTSMIIKFARRLFSVPSSSTKEDN